MSNNEVRQRTLEESSWFRSRFHLIGIASVMAVIGVWTLITELKIVPELYLPSPTAILRRFFELRKDLGRNFLLTLYRMMVGYLIGCISGILVAVLMGRNRVFEALVNPIVQMLKPIPPLVIAPFAILWFGTSELGVFFLVIFGCFFVMVVDSTEAIRNVPKIYKWAAAALGGSQNQVYWRVVLPCIVPAIVGGLRVSVVTAFNLATLAEFNIASAGLGDIIIRGYRFLRSDLLFAGVLCVVGLSLVLDLVILTLSRRLLKWAY